MRWKEAIRTKWFINKAENGNLQYNKIICCWAEEEETSPGNYHFNAQGAAASAAVKQILNLLVWYAYFKPTTG